MPMFHLLNFGHRLLQTCELIVYHPAPTVVFAKEILDKANSTYYEYALKSRGSEFDSRMWQIIVTLKYICACPYE